MSLFDCTVRQQAIRELRQALEEELGPSPIWDEMARAFEEFAAEHDVPIEEMVERIHTYVRTLRSEVGVAR